MAISARDKKKRRRKRELGKLRQSVRKQVLKVARMSSTGEAVALTWADQSGSSYTLGHYPSRYMRFADRSGAGLKIAGETYNRYNGKITLWADLTRDELRELSALNWEPEVPKSPLMLLAECAE